MILRENLRPAFDGLGLGVTGALAVLLIYLHPSAQPPDTTPPPASVQLSLVETPAPPPQPEPAPPAPQAPPVAQAPPPVMPRPDQRAAPMARHPPRRSAKPRPPTPDAPQAAPSPPGAPVIAAPSPQAAMRDATAEDSYVAAMHAWLEAHTAPPDSAAYRLLRPAGRTLIDYMVTRQGRVDDVDIARSSGSALLDRQAEEIVEHARFAPMPDQAFAGEAAHKFDVWINFRPTGSYN